VLERLRNNLALKLLSVGIALAGWAYLRLTPNPVIAARFQQQVSVPITTTGLAPDEIAHYTDRQAVVAVDVPPGGAAIRPEMVRTVLELEGRSPGVYNVPVEVIAPKFEIKSLSPASVTLAIERVENRTLPVSVHYTSGLRGNIVVQGLTFSPGYATLHAPTSDLARVVAVRIDVPLPTQPHTLDAMMRPIAIDARGNELAGIAVAPNLLRVRARFVASGNR
jgi:hypothetical protein